MNPLVTVVIPSLNQGRFLEKAIESLFCQKIPVEVFIQDGGSTDNSVEIIKKWESRIKGWESRPDKGQAFAINKGISKGFAPYVCWLNSDDWLLPGALDALVSALVMSPSAPAVYGRVNNYLERSGKENPVWVEPFSKRRLSMRCIVSQPGTLIRRNAWDTVGGLDESLSMAMDYDLWWRLLKNIGPLKFVDQTVAVNRVHADTKTENFRALHYQEAMAVVKKYNGTLPLKWIMYRPYSVWVRSLAKIFND